MTVLWWPENPTPAANLSPRACKVMRVITRLNIGGPAVHSLLLTRGLAPLGYRTVLVAGACEQADGDMSYLLAPGDRIARVPELSRSVRPWRNLTALWRLWRLMRRERPEIVHTHTAMAGCVGRLAAILAGVPVIVHTFHGNSLRHYFPPLASAIFCRIERLLARHTDTICVVAPQQAEELSGEFAVAPRERFRVVRLGVDLDSYLAIPPAPSGGVLRVAWLGRLVPVKNLPLLVRTIERTLERSGRIEFTVCGDGPDRGLVRSAVERFGNRVVWRGWEPDVPGLLRNCHVLLQTSSNEGTPLALIQGMAAARPFVSTAAGGVVDLVAGPPLYQAAGCRWYRNGVLADADPHSLADALAQLAAAPGRLERMGTAARNFAAGRYAAERLVRDIDALYRELLARNGVPVFPGEMPCTS